MIDSTTAPTLSTPFIYLKLKSIKESMQRKIAYPTSLNQLLKTASRIYKDSINVQSLFTEDGILIKSLNDVVPGSVILCSELLPNEINQTKNKSPGTSTPKKRTSSVMSKTSFSRIFGNIGDSPITNSSKKDTNNSSKRESSNSNQPNSGKRETGNSGKRDNQAIYGKMNNLFMMSRRETQYGSNQGKSKKKNSPPKKIDSSSVAAAKQARLKENRMNALKQRLSLTPQSRLPEQIESPTTPSPNKQNGVDGSSISLRKSENVSPNGDYLIDDDSCRGKTEEEIEEANNSKIHDVISKMLNGASTQSESREALLDMNDEIRPFMSHLIELENDQQSRWFNKAIEIINSFGFPKVSDVLLGYDSMIGLARSIIVNHRLIKRGGSLHRFNIAITGPKQSGKSTFLSIFVQEMLLELIVTNKWKEYFIFALDMDKIAEKGNDFESLYTYIVKATFKQLEYQCPNSSQYFPMITKYFLSVLSLQNPPQFSKPFHESEQTRTLAILLQKVADQLSGIWKDPDAFNQFITNIIMFPKMMADIFNFKRLILVFDNFESCDLFIPPAAPFDTNSEYFQLSLLIIFLLRNNDFLISCKNHSFLTNLLLSVDDPPVIDYVSTLDISIDDIYSKYVFNATINDDIVPLSLEHCGGIPSYVYSWISLNEFYDQVSKVQGRKEKEEADIFLSEKVEELMRLLYVCDNDKEMCIESVTRVKAI